jgi:hypothetical protein
LDAFFNAAAILANATWGIYVTEGILGIGDYQPGDYLYSPPAK